MNQRLHRERPRPAKVKVHSGETPSTHRVPVASEPRLDLAAAEERRDYAHFLAERQEADLEARFRHRLRRLYAPYSLCMTNLTE